MDATPLPIEECCDGQWDVAVEGSGFRGPYSAGLAPGEAGVAVGVSEGTGRWWFREAGGVKPQFSKPTMSGLRPRLTLADRIEIQAGIHAGESLRSVGRRLGRPASTIKREVDNNCELGGFIRSVQHPRSWRL